MWVQIAGPLKVRAECEPKTRPESESGHVYPKTLVFQTKMYHGPDTLSNGNLLIGKALPKVLKVTTGRAQLHGAQVALDKATRLMALSLGLPRHTRGDG